MSELSPEEERARKLEEAKIRVEELKKKNKNKKNKKKKDKEDLEAAEVKTETETELEPTDTNAVSYTHLDVYKRQVPHSVLVNFISPVNFANPKSAILTCISNSSSSQGPKAISSGERLLLILKRIFSGLISL